MGSVSERSAVAAGAGVVLGRVALSAVRKMATAGAFERTNYRGRRVSLAAGPALAMATSVAGGLGAADRGRGDRGRGDRGNVSAAALVAGLGAGAVGLYDDMAGRRPEHHAKGFRGHLRALREGRVTTGLVKVVGVSAVGLIAASMLPARGAAPHGRRPGRAYRALDLALGAGVIAGTANLVNLLDLRPGRALKASLILATPAILDALWGQGPTDHPRSTGGSAVAAGAAGAAAALLADDLAERTMIGDSGANAIGAVLGVAAAARSGLAGRAALLTGIAALTAASERVSFTEVIEATPGLRHLDRLGRRA